MTSARLLIDGAQSGTWNMAVDEVLLQAAQQGVTTLRFYQWTPATLSLGYFQSLADRASHLSSQDCPVVRRSTGGGAIVHDRELTYSFALPCQGRFSALAASIYDAFHASLVDLLANWGIAAERCGRTLREREIEFLCFARRSQGDVLLGGYKIAGSAQRRKEGGLLQHGSILLQQSLAAPELPGIAEIAGQRVEIVELIEGWQPRLASQLGLEFAAGRLSDAEIQQCQSLASDKFDAPGWINKRGG